MYLNCCGSKWYDPMIPVKCRIINHVVYTVFQLLTKTIRTSFQREIIPLGRLGFGKSSNSHSVNLQKTFYETSYWVGQEVIAFSFFFPLHRWTYMYILIAQVCFRKRKSFLKRFHWQLFVWHRLQKGTFSYYFQKRKESWWKIIWQNWLAEFHHWRGCRKYRSCNFFPCRKGSQFFRERGMTKLQLKDGKIERNGQYTVR